MPVGWNPEKSGTFSGSVTPHQMAAIIALLALLFIIGVERGFRGLKIDIS
jgi:hypothetical protein